MLPKYVEVILIIVGSTDQQSFSSFKFGFLNIFLAKTCCVVCHSSCFFYSATNMTRKNVQTPWSIRLLRWFEFRESENFCGTNSKVIVMTLCQNPWDGLSQPFLINDQKYNFLFYLFVIPHFWNMQHKIQWTLFNVVIGQAMGTRSYTISRVYINLSRLKNSKLHR